MEEREAESLLKEAHKNLFLQNATIYVGITVTLFRSDSTVWLILTDSAVVREQH